MLLFLRVALVKQPQLDTPFCPWAPRVSQPSNWSTRFRRTLPEYRVHALNNLTYYRQVPRESHQYIAALPLAPLLVLLAAATPPPHCHAALPRQCRPASSSPPPRSSDGEPEAPPPRAPRPSLCAAAENREPRALRLRVEISATALRFLVP
ncbi:hypothetical protein VPH35_017407 [Triticum aestivum]